MIGMHCVATLLFTELHVPQLRKAASEGENGRTRVVWTSSGMAEEGSPKNGIEAVLTGMPSGLVLRIINARVTHGHDFNSRVSRDIHVRLSIRDILKLSGLLLLPEL